jgi:hypothetical protein
MRLQLQVDLEQKAIARALKTVRATTGLNQVDAATKLGLIANSLQARETRGLANLDEIDKHLRTLGFKATLIITDDVKETNNGTVRGRDGLRN